MKILKQNEYKEGAKILKKGGLIAFPTETVFGLGVIFDKKESYERLVAVKRRPPEKPFTLMLADPKDVNKYAELTKVSEILVKEFMPGQFTIITKAKSWLPEWCVSKEGMVGIRIANHDLVRNLIRKTGKPLLVPSANKAGEPPANKTEEVVSIFDGEIDATIEGESISQTPSTIVVVDDSTVHMIREGVVTLDEINKAIQKETIK